MISSRINPKLNNNTSADNTIFLLGCHKRQRILILCLVGFKLIKENNHSSSICACYVGYGKDCLSSSIELSELVISPWLNLWIVVFQVADSSVRLTSLFDVPLVPFIHIVMEWIFKGNGVGFVGALRFNSQCSNDGFVCSPRVRDQSSSIEESRPHNVSFKVFFKPAFFELPANDFKVGVRVINDLKLMQAVAVEVVALSNRLIVEVKVGVVMIAKVVGGIDVAHKQKLSQFMHISYLFQYILPLNLSLHTTRLITFKYRSLVTNLLLIHSHIQFRQFNQFIFLPQIVLW